MHLAPWFEWQPILPGETAMVSARLAPATAPTSAPASLEAPDGFAVDTPAFRSLADNELAWRIRASRPGRGTLRVAFGRALAEKEIVAGREFVPVSPARVSGNAWHRLAWPGEPALDSRGPALEIRVHYPSRTLNVGSCRVHWLVILLVASIGFGLALKRPLGIEF